MPVPRLTKLALRITAIPLALYLILVIVVYFAQRSLLYFPSHNARAGGLKPWLDGDRTLGYCREVPKARTVWLMLYGNGGQAADREYVLGHLSDQDSLYVLEYPGYGQREGSPTRESMNAAAAEAYQLLRSRNPNTPVCVLAESIGSGPACALAEENVPPDKLVLVVPFDTMITVAFERFPFLPVGLLLCDPWDNIAALHDYSGPIDIFGATADKVILFHHAENLAHAYPAAHFVAIPGGHNDWSKSSLVKIER